jgi:hypothetical protein
MRFLVFVLCFVVASLSPAQAPSEPAEGTGSVLRSVRPDLAIVIEKHETGADMVQIRMLAEDYPRELLERQIHELARQLNSNARGLAIAAEDLGGESLVFLTATFATNGLIDRDQGVLRIQPILRAFAGAPEPHTVQGLMIAFQNEEPTPQMLQSYRLPGVVEAQANATAHPKGIEYRVRLISQDPEKIVFPEKLDAPPPATATIAPGPNPMLILGLFGVAAVALAGLVYLALLRAGRRVRT